MNRSYKQLYEQIIKNISREVKYILNEDIQKFDVTDYADNDILDYNTINNITNTKYINDTKILWSDLNIYILKNIINNVPKTGYPIGINIIDNKYVSLKYMSKYNYSNGSMRCDSIVFNVQKINNPNIKFDNSLYEKKIKQLQVKIKHNQSGAYYNLIDNNYIYNRFKYFNGKEQTKKFINDDNNHYPAIYSVYRFCPGDTKPGDWYMPEIGELMQIYVLTPVINYICDILDNLGFNDYIYKKIRKYLYWSSTPYDDSYINIVDFYENSICGFGGLPVPDVSSPGISSLAMYELDEF